MCLWQDMLWHTHVPTQGQAVLQTKVALQPASLKSKLHTGLTAAVDKRHVKVHKVSGLTTCSFTGLYMHSNKPLDPPVPLLGTASDV